MCDPPGYRNADWSFLGEAAVAQGFAAIGVAPAGPVDAAAASAFESWIGAGRHGSMRYLERHRAQRADPRHESIVADADVVIVAALPYAAGAAEGGLWDWVAAHARGRDYHATVRERLTEIARAIEGRFQGCRWRVFVDTAPIMERTWATAACIGSIGRHGGVIVPGVGARVALGEIVCAGTPRPECPPPTARFQPCADCDRCISACPTGAIAESGVIDARRCLSYQTIEHREADPPPDIARRGRLVFGCDECTAACPLEIQGLPSGLESPPRRGPANLGLEHIRDAAPEELSAIIAGTCLERTGAQTIQRNARALATRKPPPEGPVRGMGGTP